MPELMWPRAEVPNLWAMDWYWRRLLGTGPHSRRGPECNALGSSQNHPPDPGPWKNCPPLNGSLVLERLGATDLEGKTARFGVWNQTILCLHALQVCSLDREGVAAIFQDQMKTVLQGSLETG